MGLTPILLLVLTTDAGPAPCNSFSATKLGLQLVETPSSIAYLKPKLQQFLKICMSTKKPFNNKFHSILKACFSNLYFQRSHLICYQISQQCQNQFAIARAINNIYTSFVTLFLRDNISIY